MKLFLNILKLQNKLIFLAYTQQYNDFNGLIETNRANGQEFTILAFPCNQFFLQEPADNHEIINGFLSLIKFFL